MNMKVKSNGTNPLDLHHEFHDIHYALPPFQSSELSALHRLGKMLAHRTVTLKYMVSEDCLLIQPIYILL